MTERFMVDDCGTLIDMTNRNTYDYVSDVCDLLNEQQETIHRLKQNIDELLSVNVEEELLKENEQLKNICKNLINEVNNRGITVTMTDDCKELLEWLINDLH